MNNTPLIVLEPPPGRCIVSLTGSDDFRGVPVRAWKVVPCSGDSVIVFPMIDWQDARSGLVPLEYERDLGAGYQQEDELEVPWRDEARAAALPYFDPEAIPGSRREQRYGQEYARAYTQAQLRHLAEIGYRPAPGREDAR